MRVITRRGDADDKLNNISPPNEIMMFKHRSKEEQRGAQQDRAAVSLLRSDARAGGWRRAVAQRPPVGGSGHW